MYGYFDLVTKTCKMLINRVVHHLKNTVVQPPYIRISNIHTWTFANRLKTISDDIGMEALSGTPGERCAAMLAAGCDVVLECSGDIEAMRATADAASPLTTAASARLDRALAEIGPPDETDPDLTTARLTSLINATTV